MRRDSQIRKIILSSWFLAAIPSTAVILSLIFTWSESKSRAAYFVYLFVYLLFVLFAWTIKRIKTKELADNENLRHELKVLQIKGIKAQIDPHFIFNILNSIASLIYLDNPKSAYDYLIKFTQLLRAIFNDSESLYRTLWEEMEFVTTYLDLEKLRFGDLFQYEIFIEDGISQREMVPRLVLQTFAENALSLGIIPLSHDGVIRIRIEKDKEYLKAIIDDNGIERSTTEQPDISAKKRLELAMELYGILNQINKQPIKHTFTDIYADDGNRTGTRAEVWIPLEVAK
jgi:sensor histidine kinase YesM